MPMVQYLRDQSCGSEPSTHKLQFSCRTVDTEALPSPTVRQAAASRHRPSTFVLANHFLIPHVYFDYPVQVLSKSLSVSGDTYILASITAQPFSRGFYHQRPFPVQPVLYQKVLCFYTAFHHRWGHGSWKAGGKKRSGRFSNRLYGAGHISFGSHLLVLGCVNAQDI